MNKNQREIFIEVATNRKVYTTPSFSFRTVIFFRWDDFLAYISKKEIRYQAGFILNEKNLPKRMSQITKILNQEEKQAHWEVSNAATNNRKIHFQAV